MLRILTVREHCLAINVMQHALKLGPVAVLPEQKSSIFRFSLLDGLSLVTKLHEPNWKGQTKRRQQNQEGKVPSDILSRGTEAARGILLTHLGKCGCLLTERVPWDIHTGRCLPLQCRYGCSLRCYCDSLQFLGRKGRSAHPDHRKSERHSSKATACFPENEVETPFF